MHRTHGTHQEVLQTLHEQGSRKITLEALEEHCKLVNDWQQPETSESFPCVMLQNGVRWFYDKERRPTTKTGAPLKALSPVGHRAFLGNLEGTDADLVIFEGERDWLTAVSLKVPGAVCAGGAENVDVTQRHHLARRSSICVMFDNDEAGQSAARKLCAQIKQIGTRTVKNALIPMAGGDFSDWAETLDGETAAGDVASLIRHSPEIGKREATKILREQEADDGAAPNLLDEFLAQNGDPVVLVYAYKDPEHPEDQSQPVQVRFAHFDVAKSRKSGIRVVDYVDSWRFEPETDPQDVPMYRQEAVEATPVTEERPPVVRPLTGDWTKKRVILLPTGASEYGTSEGLFDEVSGFVDRWFVCEEPFKWAMAAYVMLSYRYRDAGFETIPYIRVMGPVGSGKTRFCRVMRELCYRSALLTGMRPPHLYRMLSQLESGVTMIIEEFSVNERTDDGREFINMLNAGNQRGSWVPRMTGHNFSDMEFLPVFCPKVLTMKSEFADPGMIRRCITGRTGTMDIPDGKKFAKLPPEFYREADQLRRQLLDWRFAKFLQEAPEEFSGNGLDMGVWQNWYPVMAMVPNSRQHAADAIMGLASVTERGLSIAHQAGPEATAIAACIKNSDDRGRAWLHLVLADLNDSDRNARWQRQDLLRVVRSLGIEPKRSKVKDGDGNFVNEFYVPVEGLEGVVHRFRFDLDLSKGDGVAAHQEVM